MRKRALLSAVGSGGLLAWAGIVLADPAAAERVEQAARRLGNGSFQARETAAAEVGKHLAELDGEQDPDMLKKTIERLDALQESGSAELRTRLAEILKPYRPGALVWERTFAWDRGTTAAPPGAPTAYRLDGNRLLIGGRGLAGWQPDPELAKHPPDWIRLCDAGSGKIAWKDEGGGVPGHPLSIQTHEKWITLAGNGSETPGQGWVQAYDPAGENYAGRILWKKKPGELPGRVLWSERKGDLIRIGGMTDGKAWVQEYEGESGKPVSSVKFAWSFADLPGPVSSLAVGEGWLAAAGGGGKIPGWLQVRALEDGKLLWEKGKDAPFPVLLIQAHGDQLGVILGRVLGAPVQEPRFEGYEGKTGKQAGRVPLEPPSEPQFLQMEDKRFIIGAYSLASSKNKLSGTSPACWLNCYRWR